MDYTNVKPTSDQYYFNEEQWLKMLFLISDTQTWLNELVRGIIFQLPIEDKKKLFRKAFYLTAPVLAHILERHYYKIQRYPGIGKFTIPVIDILSYLRDAFREPTTPVLGTLNIQRVIDKGIVIGFDKNGHSTNILTVITDSSGRIITAFPGYI